MRWCSEKDKVTGLRKREGGGEEEEYPEKVRKRIRRVKLQRKNRKG